MNLTPDQAMLLLPFREQHLPESQRLRVGVVLDRNPPSPWVDALLAFLRQIPGIDVSVFSLENRGLPQSKKPAWLADRLYSMSRAKFDPFGEMGFGGADSAGGESVDAMQTAGCGLIIWLAASRDPDVNLKSLAKHGVFTVRLGDREQAIPFWDEVANGSVTSTATIFWHDVSFAQGRVAQKAETATIQGLYITSNAAQPLIATIRMLGALCLEVQRGGPQFEKRVRSLVAHRLGEAAWFESPSNIEAAGFAAMKLMRSAQLRWSTRGKVPKWFTALRPNRGESITDPARLDLTGFADVALPPGVAEMADPFLWEAGGVHYLLFEELATGRSLGRLGCVELLPGGSCSEMKIILERPYHLSYPCVVPQNGELFLLPETGQAKRVDLYRFTRFPWEMELVASPVEGVALVDTTPVFIDGYWYFFTTTVEPFMETLLFLATRLEGPWRLHPCNPVSTTVRSCRSAGQLFWKDGRLFRPTQDCTVRYGYAMTVNEVTKLTPAEFEDRPAGYVPPSWRPNLLGTHTWNENSAFQVIDGIRYEQ